MSDGSRELEAFIAGVESLATMNETVAKAAAEPIAELVRGNIARNVTPTGEAWPAKAEGGKALEGAAAALSASARGNKVVLTIGAPWVYHDHGAGGHSDTKRASRERARAAKRREESGVKSKFHAPRRQILPDAGTIPEAMRETIEEVAERVFGKATG